MKNGALLFSVRALRLVLHLAIGLVLAGFVLATRHRVRIEPLAQWWLSVLLDVFNIRVCVHGAASPNAQILVANHISWLDIPVIAAQGEIRFVAKSDIARWPIVGWLTTAAGTFYIRRGGGVTGAVRKRIEPYLRRHGRVLFFPEGTTTDGLGVGRFHARLFAMATETGRTVQPVALRYGRAADGTRVAPYIDDDVLFWHILRLLHEPELVVEMHYCAPIAVAGRDRKALALATEQAVREVLGSDEGLARGRSRETAPAIA